MTTSDKGNVADMLVSPAMIQRWEREHAALGKQIERIETKRTAIKTMIELAQVISGDPTEPAPPARTRRSRKPAVTRKRGRRKSTNATAPIVPAAKAPAAEVVVPEPEPLARSARRARGEGEWKPIVRLIALTADHPVSYPEAKEEIRKMGPGMAEKLENGEKGFYHAVAKLARLREIVAYKGHLFSPDLYRNFQSALAAGLVRDIKIVNAAHHSPMGDATLAILSRRQAGAESGHLIWELRKNAEFAAIIDKNKTHPYNVFARLVRSGAIVKRGKRFYLLQGNETPPISEGAPIASESREPLTQPRLNHLP